MIAILLTILVGAASSPPAPVPNATQASAYDFGGPFTLTAHDGRRISDSDLKGRPYAIFFGFTHCPEVCPTTLFELTGALAALGDEADPLAVLFVTVDPERDTAEYLSSYLGAFDSRIVGLRGTPDEIAYVARRFRVTYRKVPLDGDDYTMDHTAAVFLMDRDGTFFDKIDYREGQVVQIEKLRRLLASD